MPEERSWRVVGPLSGRLTVSDEDGKPRFRRPGQLDSDSRTAASRANARLILQRTAVAVVKADTRTGEQRLGELDDTPIRTWAVETDLGQRRGDDLSSRLAARRARALELLAAATRTTVLVIEIEPQAALITGTGAGGIRNVGIELHGTHGWPIIPASGLKGVAAAFAQDTADAQDIDRIFGTPRPGRGKDDQADAADIAAAPEEPPVKPGTVSFFDALPGPDGVTVAQHDLTPHARDYHTGSDQHGDRPAPAEYFNPVPIPFLAVDGGTFIAHLVGPEGDVAAAADLLRAAMDDIGVGAKTSAGYGYLTATARPLAAAPAVGR
jgi:CRISPR type III-B/RAMP module RAMP protein Cmr6